MAAIEDGVFYRMADYIGVMRRLVIDIVDAAVAVFISVPLTIVVGAVAEGRGAVIGGMAVWVLVWFLYFVILKGSRFRTIGYVLTGARIVNLKGERPGRMALTGRLAFALLGPFNLLVDLLWVSSDPCRQALRDKVAHTYVVRRDAVPAGAGHIGYGVYTMFGMTLVFAEVRSAVPDAPILLP